MTQLCPTAGEVVVTMRFGSTLGTKPVCPITTNHRAPSDAQ